MVRFYNQQHRFYCGVDLHARTLSLHILDSQGATTLARTINAGPEIFLQSVAPFREGLAVACECMFAWYWLADLCLEEKIPFVLGQALYMKAIHGGKAKTDKIDAKKIAVLFRGGMLPQAYVYPKGMRETRDLLRRRTFPGPKRPGAPPPPPNPNHPVHPPAPDQEALLRPEPRRAGLPCPLRRPQCAQERRTRSRPARHLRPAHRRAGAVPG